MGINRIQGIRNVNGKIRNDPIFGKLMIYYQREHREWKNIP